MPVKKRSLALAVLALLLVACGSGSPAQTARPTPSATSSGPVASALTPGPMPSPTPIGPPGEPGCHPASPSQSSGIAGPEIEGTSANASLWALLFAAPQVGQDVKIAWHMTGMGDLHLVAIGPQGQRVAPDWGPEAHGSSNWSRPGDEWGAGFTVPVAGCWDLHASRTDAFGDVWLVFVN